MVITYIILHIMYRSLFNLLRYGITGGEDQTWFGNWDQLLVDLIWIICNVITTSIRGPITGVVAGLVESVRNFLLLLNGVTDAIHHALKHLMETIACAAEFLTPQTGPQSDDVSPPPYESVSFKFYYSSDNSA